MRGSIDSSISEEDFVNALFEPYIEAGHVKGKSGDYLYLNKSRVSGLLAQKDDVPQAMRKALKRIGIRKQTQEGFAAFVAENFNSEELGGFVDTMQAEIELSESISAKRKAELNSKRIEPVSYLLETFLEAIRLSNKKESQTSLLWKRGMNSLELILGDLLQFGFQSKGKKIVVIPVNTTFDTDVSSSASITETVVVSPNTLHGKWLARCKQIGLSIANIHSSIVESLEKQGKPECVSDIGTIVTVPVGDVTFVLLAISRFDAQQVAHSSRNDLQAALLSLLNYYNEHGNGFPLYLPLVGTGRSRACLSYVESFDMIRSVMLSNTQLMQGKMIIVATDEAMKEISEVITKEGKV